jgi:hypothetical protein
VAATLSIIDTLTTGFNTVTKKPWLAVVPAVLDLFLWLGPKLSAAPVINQMVATFRQAMQAVASTGTQDANLTNMFETLVTELQTTVGHTNLFALLAWGQLGMPSIAGGRPISPEVDRVIELSSYGQMLGGELLVLAVGLLMACFFLGLLGQEVRTADPDLAGVLHRLPMYWLRMTILFVPFGIMLIILLSVSFILGVFAFFIWVIILWAMFYLFFVPQAITLLDAKPLAALWSSFAVVRSSFWSTLGLVLLVNVISLGLGLVLRALLASPVGTVVAILVNAYVGTGLTAATFVFFRERITAWHAAQQQMRSA